MCALPDQIRLVKTQYALILPKEDSPRRRNKCYSVILTQSDCIVYYRSLI